MEIAFITANKLRIELANSDGKTHGKILAFFNQRPSRFIGTMLLGNNVALVIFGIAMAVVLEPFIIENISSNTGVVLLLQTIFSTLIVLAFAEFLPKTIFRINPNRALRIFAVPLIVIYYLLWIPTFITINLSNGLLWLLFKEDISEERPEFGRIDLDNYVRDSTAHVNDKESLDHEVHIFENALGFKDVKARDCMVPRTEIVALNIDDEVENLRETFIQTGLSKILIYRDSIDNIIGYVHSFELFKQPGNIKSILLPIGIVPESKPAQAILEELTVQKRSVAVVVDEFGGTAGMVTIEDVVEEIFGEIEDEHDSEELIENQISETVFELSARHEIDQLNAKYKLNLPEGEEYETVGGLIINRTEAIPALNDIIEIENFEFHILDVSHTKIETVRLEIKEAE